MAVFTLNTGTCPEGRSGGWWARRSGRKRRRISTAQPTSDGAGCVGRSVGADNGGRVGFARRRSQREAGRQCVRGEIPPINPAIFAIDDGASADREAMHDVVQSATSANQ